MRRGEGVVLFRIEEGNRKGGWREEREGGQVPCRIAVTAKTELRRLKMRGASPPAAPMLYPFSFDPERIITEFLGFSVIFYDFRIA